MAKKKTKSKARAKASGKTRATSKRKTKAQSKATPVKKKAKRKTSGRRRSAFTPRSASSADKKRAARILATLKKEFPEAKVALNFNTPFELLVATILSAQCTDARVNIVTETLFRKYRKPEDYVKVPAEEFEEDIRSTGFYRNKTKSIKAAAEALLQRHDGEVPRTMEELVELPGVGRKTANCILGNVFGVPGLVVDTHVLRISRRMGFTENTDPDKVELDMNEVVPHKEWTIFSHLIQNLGRSWCSARKPQCEDCPVSDDCPKIL